VQRFIRLAEDQSYLGWRRIRRALLLFVGLLVAASSSGILADDTAETLLQRPSISLICTSGVRRVRTLQNLSKCLRRRVTKETRYTRGWERFEQVRNLPRSQSSLTC